MVRRFQKDGARYFGPYSSAQLDPRDAADHQPLLPAAHLLGPRAREPQAALPAVPDRPLPGARASMPVPPTTTARIVEEVILFLEGKAAELVDALRERMKTAARELDFEDAARLRDQVFAIERSLERQKVAIVERDRPGRVRLVPRGGPAADLRRSTCARGGSPAARASTSPARSSPTRSCSPRSSNLYYDDENFVPEGGPPPARARGPRGARGAALRAQGREGARAGSPSAARRSSWSRWRTKNAEQAFLERTRSREETAAILERLQQRLSLAQAAPADRVLRHLALPGHVDRRLAGGEHRRRARQGALPPLQDQDASPRRTTSPRCTRCSPGGCKRGLAEDDLPDLIVIDGGKGQLASAHAAAKDLGVEALDMVGLAKSRDLDDGGIDRAAPSVRSPERVFLLGNARTRSCSRRTPPSSSCSPGCATRRTASRSPSSRS